MSSSSTPLRAAPSKRERTRAALIRATVEVVSEQGFAAASLEAIASRAGMTKGAVYSNFSGKAELVLEAIRDRGLTLPRPSSPPRSVAEALDQLRSGLRQVISKAATQTGFLAEFPLQALADSELRKGLEALFAASFESAARDLASLTDLGEAVDPRALAVTLQSIAMGFLVQSRITPDDVTDEVIGQAFRALAEGLVRRR